MWPKHSRDQQAKKSRTQQNLEVKALERTKPYPPRTHPNRPTHIPFQMRLAFTAADGAKRLYVRTVHAELETDREVVEKKSEHRVVALSTIHSAAALAHRGKYQDARVKLILTLRLLQRTISLQSDDTAPLKPYLAYIVQSEKLDGFMREAIARETVFGGKLDSRDDAASKAMYQMKSLSMEEFDLCSRSCL